MISNPSNADRTTYDALIVGSGITGGWAAKELCEKGLKVLLIERGSPLEHPNYPKSNDPPWAFSHRGALTAAEKEIHHIQKRHFSISEENKHFYINDLENPYVERSRYDWIRADVLGGRSLLWGRLCYRWSDLDFEANARDGFGVDWPIRYKDIAPWYDYVEKFIGVSGQADAIPHLPDGHFQPPMEMNCAEMDFKQKLSQKFPDRKLTIGRVANLTEGLPGRAPCQYRNQCHRGCSFGAYFSTPSATLPAARATGNLTVVTDTLVNQVLYDDNKRRASGVETVHKHTGATTVYRARVVFLNASTLGTTFVLLNSTSARFPNGLGNDSDQVGRNLMDHHKGSGASATVEGFDDQYYTGRRPTQVYIPRFRNVSTTTEKFVRGYGLQGGAARGNWQRVLFSPAIGASLKDAAQTPGPWTFRFQGYGECLPYADNRVTLSAEVKDKWNRPALEINCSFKENEHAMNKDMAVATAEMLAAAGYQNVKEIHGISFPGNANHEMGTARMGKDPKTSVLNAFNQMHAVPNVFITDGSCMTSSSCVNPSLTYMALTARACAFAVDEMKKLNI